MLVWNFGAASLYGSTWIHVLWFLLFVVLFGIFGATIGLHRYWTHDTFELSKPWERFITLMTAFNGQGPPFLWILNHEVYHHRNSDKETDPHKPKDGFWHALFMWTVKNDALSYKQMRENPRELKRAIVKYRKFISDPYNMFIDHYFLHILWGTTALVALLDWKIALYGMIPAILWTLIASGFSNTFGHYPWFGYRNYDTDDNSTNNPLLAIFTFGESLHNNHHANWKRYNFSDKWYEPDLAGFIVDLIRKK